MQNLSPLWFLVEPLDFEHKQYVILDYVQHIEKEFKALRLNPHLRQLLEITTFLETFKKKRSDTFSAFQFFMKKHGDYTEKQLKMYHGDAENNKNAATLIQIIEWSLPKLQDVLSRGSLLWDGVADCLIIDYIGEIPKDRSEGYIIIHVDHAEVAEVFYYKVSPVFVDESKYRGFILKNKKSTRAVMDENGVLDFEKVKEQYIMEQEALEERLFISVRCDIDFPKSSSLHPVMKHETHQRLMKDFFKA